ncbi:DEAD/DEAH box helicase [unidentified bacterial endosymbiont]|uniref:DEAD/DEAH box helicase n=1 Tax=unidentified bacterial endosymbiont TaxID=2355 RepID=UPI00209F16D2|nr:DEAD/DEAH box helicase [unidentified bacterial endosymbiont]
MTNTPNLSEGTRLSLPQSAATNSGLELEISPTGCLQLGSSANQHELAPALSAAAVTRISQAFARGSSQGLLHLGAVELATPLPPSLAFGRAITRLLITRLCATPDLASNQDSQCVNLPIATPCVELEKLLQGMPPLRGAEYLTLERLEILWLELQQTVQREIRETPGDLQGWLQGKHPSWNLVGRVCFHLAENKSDLELPFAFLTTYATGVSQHARVQHQPLGRALQEYAEASGAREALLKLLLPVNRAAEQCPWLKSLVESGAIFRPLAWTPSEAHRLLHSLPILEASGIVVRIPDWWKPSLPPRPQVQIKIGHKASGLGLETLLDFDLSISLAGQELSAADWEELLQAGDGLVRLKGHWVELDREKLAGVLAHWKTVGRAVAAGGLSFLEGMRLLAGVAVEESDQNRPALEVAPWSTVVAGDWLQQALEGLRNPHSTTGSADPGPELKATLRPYQQQGVRWLWWLHRLGLGGCLADDMGLGKTVQVLALFLLAKREADPTVDRPPHLLVLPASLIGNWQAEMARFAPSLSVLVAHPSVLPVSELANLPAERLQGVDVVIASYQGLIRLSWLLETQWSLVVLDEAQAIKNPAARQTQAAKALKSRGRLALTGTPVENQLGDLWSLFDFISPGLLGSDKAFGRLVRRLEQASHPGGEGSYAPLRNLVQPYLLRRLKSDQRIMADLPDKSEVKAYCTLSREQASLYAQVVSDLAKQLEQVEGIHRRGAVLACLMRLKQICNHPSQWLGDECYDPHTSGKFARLRELAESMAARQEKVLLFTQFQEMTEPLARFLYTIFGRAGLVLHGKTPIKARQALVNQFQQAAGPPFFVLSIKAGGTGLNLTAASQVIHFDRWWNPAVENQATDRAYRIGQKKNVLVHKFICRGTLEEKIDALVEAKLGLSNNILSGSSELLLTEMSNDALLKLVALDINSAMGEQ